ncbi:MAG: cbb3-type cytochrome c oxidase subunit II [Acidimicrobiia bacterium]
MTAETSPTNVEQADATSGTVRTHLLVATLFLIAGLIGGFVAALQLVIPDLFSDIQAMTYGRIAPASQTFIVYGWAIIGLLGMSYFALARVTGNASKLRVVSLVSLVLIAVGSFAGAAAIQGGLGTGVPGQESPVWARAVVALGVVLAAFALTRTAKEDGDHIGVVGWYLAAAPVLLSATLITGLIPLPDGIAGPILSEFSNAGVTLFIITASVGLVYFAFGSISGVELTKPRPLAALGFWSLILAWAFASARPLIYTPTPGWYQTIAVAFSIGSLIPALAIAADIGLMLKGTVGAISDRATLRYATVASLSLGGATILALLLTWRVTSSVAAYSTLVQAFSAALIFGGASFAIFAVHSIATGGRASGTSFHFSWSVIGVTSATAALLAGGVATGFSWAAGPASQAYANTGRAWKITVDTAEPFLWIAAASVFIYLAAQVAFLIRIGSKNQEDLPTPDHPPAYDLELEGSPRYVKWRRLVIGVSGVWLLAALLTAVLPIADVSQDDATILADSSRSYADGTAQLNGRNLYISEGCVQCHTQVVRPVGTDVGLGPVSATGDYANENPALLGAYRFGPDLMHVASGEAFDPAVLASRLSDPRAAVSWSTMPSYSYLSDSDLHALVSYIETLR